MGTLEGVLARLNTRWHKMALGVLIIGDTGHLTEHAVQAIQIFVLGWQRQDSRGLVGEWIPWLVTSETMHYAYAIFTLVGITILLPGFFGQARFWWFVALVMQAWHHFEHTLLLYQQLTDPFFGEAVPTSIIQLWLPRVELHLFYNGVVFSAMVIALCYHLRPGVSDTVRCTCSRWRFKRASSSPRAA